jgi:hypothetical protein
MPCRLAYGLDRRDYSMRCRGYVSLWLGTSVSNESLESYVALHYSEDGDLVPSDLMEDFNIPSYDEDFLESEYRNLSEHRIVKLLKGFSYWEQIAERFAALCGDQVDVDVNAVVVLYDFNASPSRTRSSQNQDVQLSFMGVVTYEP